MANIFENKDRRVIPNWRSFNKTFRLGELNSPHKNNPKLDISLSIDSYLEDWRNNNTIAYAADLISAAVVNGFERNKVVVEAAQFIINNYKEATQSQISLAIRVIPDGDVRVNIFKLDRITIDDFNIYVNPKLIWQKIQTLKRASIEFPYNPIGWIELSRQYSIIGQEKKAIKAMKIALQLTPENRFVLRCAVRLFAHFNNFELAHDTVRKNRLTNFDPWLTSAEIAMATIRNRSSKFINRGQEMISSNNFSSFSTTELASALGTVELINGSRKKSRDFFRKSLESPNDNSLAQIEWASKKDKGLEITPSEFKVIHSFEAKALDDLEKEKLHDALNNTFRWFLDMPYLKRAIMFGSHISSSLLDDQATSREFLKAGLISHPNDPQLINNIVYSLAMENNISKATEYLKKLPPQSYLEKVTSICLTATRGLVNFRSGVPDIGRKLYLEAIQEAKEIQNQHFNWLAILNYAREELLVKSEYVEAIMETVIHIPSETEDVDIKKLKQEVTKMYVEYKATK